MKKCLFFLIAQILWLQLYAKKFNREDSLLLKYFLENEYIVEGNLKNISGRFYSNYKKVYNQKFNIADSNSFYNPTDMWSDDVPYKKIIFCGLSSANLNIGFIFYIRGGVGQTFNIILYDFKNRRKPLFLYTSINEKVGNIEELKRQLKIKYNLL